MQRKTNFSKNEYYHIYNRGNNKGNLFLKKDDYDRFILLLYLANNIASVHISNIPHQGRTLMRVIQEVDRKETLVDVGAYCLMPNHFHILLREKEAGGISTFMQKLSTGYSMYFNKRHERTGSLFEGRFKAEHVDRDEYLKYLFSYIHLNPVKLIEPKWKEVGVKDLNKINTYLNKYIYSSYIDYLEENRIEKKIINKVAFPEYFEEPHDFKSFIDEWLDYNDIKVRP